MGQPPTPATRHCLRLLWNTGAALIAVAALLFSWQALCVKNALGRGRVRTEQIVLVQSLISLAAITVWIMWSRWRIWHPSRRINLLTLLRAGLGSATIYMYYMSLQDLSLRDAVTLFFCSPVIAAVLELAIFPQGVVTTWSLLGTCFTVAGVVLVSQPDCLQHSRIHTAGMFLAIGAAFMNASAFVCIRLIGGAQNALVLTWWYSLVLAASMLPPVLLRGPPPLAPGPVGRTDNLLLLGASVTQLGGQVLLNRGLQLESATRGSAINVLQVLLSWLWDVLLLGDRFNLPAALGALCVVLGVLVVALKGRPAAAAAAPGHASPPPASPPADRMHGHLGGYQPLPPHEPPSGPLPQQLPPAGPGEDGPYGPYGQQAPLLGPSAARRPGAGLQHRQPPGLGHEPVFASGAAAGHAGGQGGLHAPLLAGGAGTAHDPRCSCTTSTLTTALGAGEGGGRAGP